MHTALFQRLTHNETAPSWRALEPALGAFVRAAHTEDLPGLAALWRALPDLPARRGGYLLDLVAHVREVPGWRAGLVAEGVSPRVERTGARPAFYAGDPPGSGQDLLAERWGLSRGVLYERLRQMMRAPYVC
ncbi:MAG: hypothetical protein M0Z85_07660 [Gammaproteobacteria bacterium]|nr:hypothetical protein [Gammaproteobacteria bacterium]